jgi:hypothetical protein
MNVGDRTNNEAARRAAKVYFSLAAQGYLDGDLSAPQRVEEALERLRAIDGQLTEREQR